MKIERIVNQPMDVNTYVVIDQHRCLIIDPSFNHTELINFIEMEELEVMAVVLTHGHFDHMISVNTVCHMYDVPLYIHPKEVEYLYDADKNLSSYFAKGKEVTVTERVSVRPIDENTTQIEGIPVTVLHVPGHSPGSIALYFKEANALFSGDVLFYQSIGRTDFAGGHFDKLKQSIQEKLFTLPDETMVYPGHGPETSIGLEKRMNPFVGF
ncbi:MAG TPA: MBL fold metallo-hydrolase [Haloplasmataceae bacterium]